MVHPETWGGGQARQKVKTWAADVSFLQQEWFLVEVHGSHSGHSDQIAIRDGSSLGPHTETAPIGGSDSGHQQTCT